jgi:hypothetical protein
VGADRTLRRWAGGATVAVRVKGRPWVAVLADMIEGVVVANLLTTPQADRLRGELWEATQISLTTPTDRSVRRVA